MCRSAPSPTPCASWSAACRSQSFARETSNTTSGFAPTRANDPPAKICTRSRFPSPAVGLVKLASLAKLNEDRGPTEIERLSRERIVTVVGNPEGIALGEAITRAERILKEMNLPPQYTYVFTGQAKTLGETGYYFMVAFALSITFMYLILAAQFESWMQPIAILMALPVTIPFGMLSLVLFHTPMDLYAMFGLFMLVGIVKKNGILQVDATNQLRAKGVSRHDAIIEANHTRLRPILMTTVMLVAAMVPIALGNGPGAGARASMAKVIIGGQMLSLVLALLVTPVFYAIARYVRQLHPAPRHSLFGRAHNPAHGRTSARRPRL